ncbi:MAG: hypothetical protein KJ062_09600, partial [Thermoanaerobaculia bacterium]|nr:hypothetical protein [Thermoanaerobaculia bacterium]
MLYRPGVTREDSFQDWLLASNTKASAERRVESARRFLDRFPDTAHTLRVASSAVHDLAGGLGDLAGADDFLVALLDEVETPETRKALTRMRLGLLAGRKDHDGLRAG